jgi:hypothetical protein
MNISEPFIQRPVATSHAGLTAGCAARNMGCDQETVRASREDYPPGRPRPSGLCHANPSSGDLSKR